MSFLKKESIGTDADGAVVGADGNYIKNANVLIAVFTSPM